MKLVTLINYSLTKYNMSKNIEIKKDMVFEYVK